MGIEQVNPNWAEATVAWEHLWHGEVYKRPLVLGGYWEGTVDGAPLAHFYRRAVAGDHDALAAEADRVAGVWRCAGEAAPSFSADHGPDQFACFLGAEFRFSESSPGTNWIDPIVEDWDAFLPLGFDESNPTYQSVLALTCKLAERSRGRYFVAPLDAHSHMDTLSALRGPQRMALDLYDHPDQVEEAMRQVRPMFPRVYDAVAEAGRTGLPGSAHGGCWGPGRFSVIQCDFIYMIGPKHFTRFVMPAIEEEAAFLDQVYFHLDGPGSFRHLDDLLSIPNMGIISVDSGDGQPVNHSWTDLHKRIIAAGCATKLYGPGLSLDRIKVLHRELGPRGVIYCPDVGTRAELEEIMTWLERNT